MFNLLFTTILALRILPFASAHIAFWHPSMWGYNVTQQTYSYDNRPVAPIKNMNFSQWWFHGHLDNPPNAGDFFELPAGQPATSQLACNRGATTFFEGSEGGNIQDPNDLDTPCPNSPVAEFHTTGFDDVKGCALAIAYESDVNQVQPEDFVVFSVNQTCVWNRFTDFQVPDRMPACPEGGCTCAWFWIHSPDSGAEENYMNGFKCNVTGSTSNVALATPNVPRRCGADPDNGRLYGSPGNCTYGAKNPFYWFNNEGNNMPEGFYSPPFYNDLYNFKDGAQDDIFVDSYISLPTPSPTAPLPVLRDVGTGSTNVSSAGISSVPSTSSCGLSANSTSTMAKRFAKRETGFMRIHSILRKRKQALRLW